MRGGVAELARGETVIRPGDQVVAVVKPGLEPALRRILIGG
jgi:Trk K+ transport system NAD-binding subunit